MVIKGFKDRESDLSQNRNYCNLAALCLPNPCCCRFCSLQVAERTWGSAGWLMRDGEALEGSLGCAGSCKGEARCWSTLSGVGIDRAAACCLRAARRGKAAMRSKAGEDGVRCDLRGAAAKRGIKRGEGAGDSRASPARRSWRREVGRGARERRTEFWDEALLDLT